MSTTTETRPDHRTRPRKKRPPCYRDQQILLQYLGGRSQEELAEKHRVSQPRISKILQRVRKWRANRRPQEAGELTHQEQQRLDYWQRRQMQEDIYRRSLRDYDHAPKQLTTSKVKTDKDGNEIHEVTTRDILPPVGLLKTAQRSAENLAKEADRDPPPQVQDPQWEDYDAHHQMLNRLMNLRREAEESGKVPRSREHRGDNFGVVTLVEHWLAALLGDTDANLPDDVHLRDGDSLGALIGFYRSRQAELRRQNLATGWITPEQAAAADAREVAAMGFGSSSNGYNGNVNKSAQVDAEPQVAANAGEEDLVAADGVAVVGAAAHSDAAETASTPADESQAEAIAKARERCAYLERWLQRPTGGVNVGKLREGLAEAQAELQDLLAGTGAVVDAAAHSDAAEIASTPAPAVGRSADHSHPDDNTAPPPPLEARPGETPRQRQKREAADKAERHRLHMLRLDLLREAQRHGLPTQFVFDPEDGPLPPRGGYF